MLIYSYFLILYLILVFINYLLLLYYGMKCTDNDYFYPSLLPVPYLLYLFMSLYILMYFMGGQPDRPRGLSGNPHKWLVQTETYMSRYNVI